MNYSNLLCAISALIAAIGALNWGLYAYNHDYNLVDKVFKKDSVLSKVVYALIAVCGVIVICCQIKWIRKKSFTQE